MATWTETGQGSGENKGEPALGAKRIKAGGQACGQRSRGHRSSTKGARQGGGHPAAPSGWRAGEVSTPSLGSGKPIKNAGRWWWGGKAFPGNPP